MASDQVVGQSGVCYVLNKCFLSVTAPEWPGPKEMCPAALQEASALDLQQVFFPSKMSEAHFVLTKEVALQSFIAIPVRVCTHVHIRDALFPKPLTQHLSIFTKEVLFLF